MGRTQFDGFFKIPAHPHAELGQTIASCDISQQGCSLDFACYGAPPFGQATVSNTLTLFQDITLNQLAFDCKLQFESARRKFDWQCTNAY